MVIDAYHGGIDAGTIGVDNANEKDINLGIALKLYDFIRISGINASLIRSGDYQFYKKATTQSVRIYITEWIILIQLIKAR